MDIVQILFIFQERVEIDSPESFRCRAKSSGSPPMNSPVFSPIIVLPLEAEELPGIVERESKFERMRILESFEGQTERKKLFFFFKGIKCSEGITNSTKYEHPELSYGFRRYLTIKYRLMLFCHSNTLEHISHLKRFSGCKEMVRLLFLQMY